MAFSPNASVPETALTIPAGVATAIPAFLLYGSSRWTLVIKNTGSHDITAFTTAKYVHEADTNAGPDTSLDTSALAKLTAGSTTTIEEKNGASYEKIQFTLTSTSGTTITYSFEGRG